MSFRMTKAILQAEINCLKDELKKAKEKPCEFLTEKEIDSINVGDFIIYEITLGKDKKDCYETVKATVKSNKGERAFRTEPSNMLVTGSTVKKFYKPE